MPIIEWKIPILSNYEKNGTDELYHLL